MKSLWLVMGVLSLALVSQASTNPVLRVELRTNEVFLYVTGGTSNVQYQIWTAPNPDHNVASTNYYYWRRSYSRDFLAKPMEGEMIIYGTNTSQQPRRFFQIRGEPLPDGVSQIIQTAPPVTTAPSKGEHELEQNKTIQ